MEPYIGSVDHGKTGFLYAEPEELVGILNRLVDNSDLLKETATAAREYVLRKRLQLKHGKDRTAFYSKELSKLRKGHARIGQSAESFEEWAKLEGAVRKRRHLELRPTRFENLLQNGLVASQVRKDRELARQFFEEASAIDPDNYLSFLYGYSVLSDPVMSLRKALERNPDSLKAWILLGEELAKRGKIKEAFECFNSAAMVWPQYEIPLLRAASLLEKLGERSQAESLFDKAAKMTIHHPPAP
jgi:tetratricopeptide (TPR) repeat protein